MVGVARQISRRCAIATFLAAAVCGRVAAQPVSIATVAKIAGAVTVVRAAQTLPAAPGLGLLRGDRVVTGADGRAEINGIDGSTLVVGPASQIVMTTYAVAANGVRSVLLDLVEGILRFITQPAPGGYEYQVRTPTAVASVRSTEWIVDAGAGNTAVFAIAGSVEVNSARGNDVVLLTPGQGTDVRSGASPTPPAVWAAVRVQGVLERTRAP
jgi:hypothetical protein